mgnify:CR=1 FL=1
MYEFTEDCMIHIDNIDEEHRKLFQMLNEAFALVKETDNAASIAKNLIDNLKDYAITHFVLDAREVLLHLVQLMIVGAEKINTFKLDESSPEAARNSLNELLLYLTRWLYSHILSSDMMIGKMAPETNVDDAFAFTDKYITGIELVDEEHKHLFDIIRDTNDVIHAELLHDKYDEIIRLLSELREYTETHFSDEEELMKKIGYPEIEAQKRAHAAFVEKLVNIDFRELEAMDDNQEEYLMDLIGFLLGWLSNHILASDKKIGKYLKEHNIVLEK